MAVPLVGAGISVVMSSVPSLSTPLTHSAQIAMVEAAAALGCWIAATSFEWRDHLARAWALQGVMYAMLFLRCVGLAAGVLTGSGLAVLGDGILTTVANVGGIAATWMLARTVHIAGLGEVISVGKRTTAWAVALAFALAAAGPGAVTGLHNLLGGNPAALVSVASRAGDVGTFVLLAPILLTALTLRQGLLVWPWALLTCSGLCWLSADFSNASFMHLPNDRVGPFYDFFRSPACLFMLSAGIAQRWVVTARDV